MTSPQRLAPSFSARPKKAGAFTLVETMMAIALFSIGSLIVYETLRSTIFLSAKNVAFNISNTSLQQAYLRLLTTLESAPLFVDCANYNSTTQTFTAVSTGTWGNSVRFMQTLPIAGYVLPDNGSGYTVTNPPPPTHLVYLNSSDQLISLSYNTSLYSTSGITTSARLYPAYPSVSQTVSGGSSPGLKPGLTIDSVDTSVSGTIKVHLPTPLGSNVFLDCNRAYLMVEAAFAVIQAADGHKELLYFADTSQPNSSVNICRELDGANQTQPNDTTIPSGGTPGTFCMVATLDAVQTLLPIRTREFSNVINRQGGSPAHNDQWINLNTKFHQRQNP